MMLKCTTWFGHVAIIALHERGPPSKKCNKLSVGGQALVVQASPLDECSRNPSVSVCQLVVFWEAVLGFSGFFWRLFQCVGPFHDGWFTSTPAHTVLSVQQLLPPEGMTPMPHPPVLTPKQPFFVFLNEKSPQRGTFCPHGGSETKNGRSSKRHQNRWVQKLFWAVEKMSS